jgi:hypothetical protein
MHRALSAPVFYYSLVLNICNFNAEEIFLLEPKEQGEGGQLRGPLIQFHSIIQNLTMKQISEVEENPF